MVGASEQTPQLAHPLSLGIIFNTAVNANTNFFANSIAPVNVPCTFRIYICLSVAGILSVQRTKSSVTVAEQLNGGTALVANAAYIFDIIVDQGSTINLQTTGTGTTILKCIVIEKDTV
jgi:hypothetical protein